jgi:hypothetical protein
MARDEESLVLDLEKVERKCYLYGEKFITHLDKEQPVDRLHIAFWIYPLRVFTLQQFP